MTWNEKTKVCSLTEGLFCLFNKSKQTKSWLLEVILNKALIHWKVIEVILLIVTASTTRISLKFLWWGLKQCRTPWLWPPCLLVCPTIKVWCDLDLGGGDGSERSDLWRLNLKLTKLSKIDPKFSSFLSILSPFSFFCHFQVYFRVFESSKVKSVK